MKKLSHKIILAAVVECLIITLVISSVAIYNIMEISDRLTVEVDNILRENYDKMSRTEVETAVSM